jgi:hypothetical protein
MRRRWCLTFVLPTAAVVVLAAQPQFSTAVRAFIKVDGPVVALTSVRVIEAISIGTMNGAKYLGRDAKIGTIAVGEQADLVVVNGDPSASIGDVRNVEIVFKQGLGFDPAKLIDSVKGKAGLW